MWMGNRYWGRMDVSVHRVYGAEAKSEGQIGKWIVVSDALYGVFERMAARCVVDDFGDLVGVRA